LKFTGIAKKKEKQNRSSNAKTQCVFFLLWQHHCLGEEDNFLAKRFASLYGLTLYVTHPFVKQGLAYFPTSWDCSGVHSLCFVKFLEITYSRSEKNGCVRRVFQCWRTRPVWERSI